MGGKDKKDFAPPASPGEAWRAGKKHALAAIFALQKRKRTEDFALNRSFDQRNQWQIAAALGLRLGRAEAVGGYPQPTLAYLYRFGKLTIWSN